MLHVVFWSSPSGPAFQRVPALADAVELVQSLRNDHGVTDAEVHALTAVPLNFRTVVVVEAAGAASSAAPGDAVSGRAASLQELPPVQAGFESFTSFSHPVDEYGEELTPLGIGVPGVVPDPIGPFRSLAAVGSQAAEDLPTPHLVGLPSVAPDIEPDPAPDLAPDLASDAAPDYSSVFSSDGDGDVHAFRPLEVVAEEISAAMVEQAPEAATGETAVRSLGLFA